MISPYCQMTVGLAYANSREDGEMCEWTHSVAVEEEVEIIFSKKLAMGWLWLVGSIKL